MTYIDEFAGITSFTSAFSVSNSFHNKSWIIDSGASNHMCSNFELLINPYKVYDSKLVSLPDGTMKSVTHAGDIKLTDKLILNDALFIPSFKYNLLFVNKLTENALIRIIFYPHYCLMQDL